MNNQQRTFKDWVIATRPWSFPASSIPVIAIGCYLYYNHAVIDTPFDWTIAILALSMMVLFQAAGNLISDAADHEQGVDLPGSLNGVRHIQSGLFTSQGTRHYGLTLLTLAAIFGVAMLARVFAVHQEAAITLAPILAAIGLAGVALAVWYPQIKYHALGDIDILLCYAILPTLGLELAVTGTAHVETLLLSLPFGLQTVAILHANNTRDIRNDRRAGIHTLPHVIGGRVSQWLYATEVLLPYLLILIYNIMAIVPLPTLLAWFILPLAIKNSRWMLSVPPEDEQGIATLDQHTAQMQLFTGLLYAAGFIFGIF